MAFSRVYLFNFLYFENNIPGYSFKVFVLVFPELSGKCSLFPILVWEKFSVIVSNISSVCFSISPPFTIPTKLHLYSCSTVVGYPVLYCCFLSLFPLLFGFWGFYYYAFWLREILSQLCSIDTNSSKILFISVAMIFFLSLGILGSLSISITLLVLPILVLWRTLLNFRALSIFIMVI